MLGLSVLAMASMLTLNRPAEENICGLGVAQPVFHITVSEDPIRFNTDKTRRELASLNIDTISPFPSGVHTEVGGVTHGGITLMHNLRFRKSVDPVTRSGCVELDQVNLNIHINPTIYIANDMPNQGCWFKQVFIHEQKHVNVDRDLTKKYEGRFRDALRMMFITPADYTAGPMTETAMQRADDELHKSVAAALQVVFDQMQTERRDAQAAVDTLEEYQRLSRACGFQS